MSRSRRRRRRRLSSPSPEPAPPLQDDDLLHEILLRLPPQPPHLLCASLVCNRWRRLATDPQFLLRRRIHHRKPPLLGLFSDSDGIFSFRSTLDPPYSIPPGRFSLRLDGHEVWKSLDRIRGPALYEAWKMLDCRHGRILFDDWKRRRVVVWDPVTDHFCFVVYPPQFPGSHIAIIDSGAVLCAASDHEHMHGDCYSSPFKVVLLAILGTQKLVSVTVAAYSSETCIWSDFFSTPLLRLSFCRINPRSTLVGNAIHWMLIGSRDCIQFDLDSQRLAVTEKPPGVHQSAQIICSEDGGVAFATLSSSLWNGPYFQMWEMKVNSNGVARWVIRKTSKLQNVLGLGFRISSQKSSIVGYADDINAIFLRVHTSVYMVQLDSMQTKELFKRDNLRIYHPFTSFYTEGMKSSFRRK